jgi:acylphosphatase
VNASVAAVRYLISGRVQGVYYRARTADRAAELAIRGWAKNLSDGRVEVVAAGPMTGLTALTRWLWEGPPAAKIESVDVEEWHGAVPDDFRVL